MSDENTTNMGNVAQVAKPGLGTPGSVSMKARLVYTPGNMQTGWANKIGALGC